MCVKCALNVIGLGVCVYVYDRGSMYEGVLSGGRGGRGKEMMSMDFYCDGALALLK